MCLQLPVPLKSFKACYKVMCPIFFARQGANNYELLLENRRWVALLRGYESALSWALNAKVAELD